MAVNPYQEVWRDITPARWALWETQERTGVFEDFNPDAYRTRAGNAATVFERQVAYLFRTQLGFLDVQRGFDGNLGGSVDAAGPISQVLVEVKAHNKGVNNAMLQQIFGAFATSLHPDLAPWSKCVVSQFGFTGALPAPPIENAISRFSVVNGQLVPQNTLAMSLVARGASLKEAIEAQRPRALMQLVAALPPAPPAPPLAPPAPPPAPTAPPPAPTAPLPAPPAPPPAPLARCAACGARHVTGFCERKKERQAAEERRGGHGGD